MDHRFEKTESSGVDVVLPFFNADSHIHRSIRSILSQKLPATKKLRLIVVDDGSTEGGNILESTGDARITIIRHDINKGRAAARNTGAKEGRGEVILFLDSDCVLESDLILSSHLSVLEEYDMSVGRVNAHVAGFWGRYQNELSTRRLARLEKSMDIEAFTAQNFAIKRSAFRAIDGFDERYVSYGFEDRDFFVRARAKGLKIGLARSSVAYHEADLSLASVCAKMKKAGQCTSTLFMASHPDCYARMDYAKVDVRLHARLFKLSVHASWWLLGPCVRMADQMLHMEIIPFRLRAGCVRAFTAMAFAYGTALACGKDRQRKNDMPA